MFESVTGPDLGPALAGFDVRAASGPELVEALAASQRLVSWAMARQAELVAEVVAREPAVSASFAGDAFDVAVHEVAAAWTWSVRAAQARVDGCLEVAGRPAVLAALREGRIDWARAEAVASAVGGLATRPVVGRRGGGGGAGAGGGADRAAAAGPPGAAGAGRPIRPRQTPGTRRPAGSGGCGSTPARTGWPSCGRC